MRKPVMRMCRTVFSVFFVISFAAFANAQSTSAASALSIVAAQPTGEIASAEQTAEIRVRFSEAMVPLGRIPDTVTAPFFSIRPAVAGVFRWAGPTLLIFTPDPKTPMPRATRYDVMIAAGVAAVSGRTLERPYTFSFTTPTVRLLSTDWYRISGRFDRPAIVALRFNQPVRPADVLAHASVRYQRHDWQAPPLTAEERARMGADAAARFDAKVAVARGAAASTLGVPVVLAPDWDKKRFPPSPDLVVLADERGAGARRMARRDARHPSAGRRGPRNASAAADLRRPPRADFFVSGFHCAMECDADGYNVTFLRAPAKIDALKRAISVRDITSRAADAIVPRSPTPRVTFRARQESANVFSLEDVGYDRQPPARTFAISLDAALQADDGQTLGYSWTGIVENWHETRVHELRRRARRVGNRRRTAAVLRAQLHGCTQWARRSPVDQLMPTILELTKSQFHKAPAGPGTRRALGVTADRIQSHGLDLSRVLSPRGRVWCGRPCIRARLFRARTPTTRPPGPPRRSFRSRTSGSP